MFTSLLLNEFFQQGYRPLVVSGDAPERFNGQYHSHDCTDGEKRIYDETQERSRHIGEQI
ncbi:MAG: hypothetical protein BRD28_03240 [Bacteroidetes bacterium QH_10_64_37]|nr:MAG: hypothetical protein BRD28_03240 [Bacteroidetes bacterium QH_10_64_37]